VFPLAVEIKHELAGSTKVYIKNITQHLEAFNSKTRIVLVYNLWFDVYIKEKTKKDF
jgi:hypothetical protein